MNQGKGGGGLAAFMHGAEDEPLLPPTGLADFTGERERRDWDGELSPVCMGEMAICSKGLVQHGGKKYYLKDGIPVPKPGHGLYLPV